MKEKIKRIIFEFTKHTVIYTPIAKEKFGKTYFKAEVLSEGKTHIATWKVSHFPNRTNALRLINNN